MLLRCQHVLTRHGRKFRCKNKLLSIDATTVELRATRFDWAKFRRTIRLLVSSTCSDRKAEGDLPRREVFPKVRQLCLSTGLRFQPIDRRWGVPEEAAQDHRTMG